MLLQQQHLQGLQQHQQIVGLQQQGLLGLQPQQQQLLLYPRFQNPPMSMAQTVAQPRFLLPNPQLSAFPQPGVKRSHEQAFMPGTQGAGVPPKRPPVMYGTPPLDATGTPPPPALLPTPPSLPSYPV